MAEGDLNVESIISRLLEAMGCHLGKTLPLTETEIFGLCLKSWEIFMRQPNLLEANQAVEDRYEFFTKRQLVTLFSTPNYCGNFDNDGGMTSVDFVLCCSFETLKPVLAEREQHDGLCSENKRRRLGGHSTSEREQLERRI
ncbi:hypothetical protein MRX96_001306 [Rhipicephalus microplus]